MEAPSLCRRGCGFHGSPQQHGLCSSCYNDFLLEKIAKSSAKIPDYYSSTGAADSADDRTTHTAKPSITEGTAADPRGSTIPSEAGRTGGEIKNRCKTCKKRLGLFRFQCRCGDRFCGTHRHPEEHACEVDLKESGRRTLAEQNPACVVDRMQYRV